MKSTQVLLGLELGGARDAVGAYYRSRPLLLTLGLSVDEALASTMMRSGSMSEGRDIGVVFNLPRLTGPCVLPVCGGVGTQYTPAVGWAQALRYRQTALADTRAARSIAVAHGGDASTATNGFWAALNIATTEHLPLLFFIEDNGYGISVPTHRQTPGGNIARNLASFRGLRVLDGDGSDPLSAARLIREAVDGVRAGEGPALLRLTVPRLSGHSGQDTQTYKGSAAIAAERERDPWGRLRAQLVPKFLSAEDWDAEVRHAGALVAEAQARVERRSPPDAARVKRYLFTELADDGSIELQTQGGIRRTAGCRAPSPSIRPRRVPGSIWSPRYAARWSTSSRRTLAWWCSARTWAKREACTPPRSDCRRSSASRGSSTPACRRRASSAGPWAWPRRV